MTKPRPPLTSHKKGLKAENFARWWMRAKGYKILHQRLRTPHGELDLVASKRDILAIVEIKYRASEEEAAYAVSLRQQQRIIRAASWLYAQEENPQLSVRFDVILLSSKKGITHIEAAFDASI